MPIFGRDGDGRRVAARPRRWPRRPAGPVPAGDRRTVARGAPGAGRRRSRLVLGCGRRRHRHRLGSASDAGPRRSRADRPGPAGGAAAPSTTRAPRPSRAPRATPTASALAWEGEDGEVRRLTNARARRGGRRRRAPAPGARRPAGRPGRDPAADARRDRRRGPRASGGCGAIYTPIFCGLRRAGHRHPPRRLRGDRCSSPPTGSSDAVAWVPLKAVADEAVARCAIGPSRRSSSAARARPSTSPWTPGSRCLVGRAPVDGAIRTAAELDAPRRRPRDAVHAHLHVGHDRPAEGRGPRPRRLPDQGRPGPRPPVRPRARRHACSGSPTSAG